MPYYNDFIIIVRLHLLTRKRLVLISVVIAVVLSAAIQISNFFWPYEISQSEDNYIQLRNTVFALDPNQCGIQKDMLESDVWGLLLEQSSDIKESLLILKDGTIRYFSSDGFNISDLELIDNIKEYSERLYVLASKIRQQCTEANSFPLTAQGRVRLYIFTFDGILTAENEAGHSRNELMALSYIGQDYYKLIYLRRDILPALIKSLKVEHGS